MINEIKSLHMPKNDHFACPTQPALLIEKIVKIVLILTHSV